MDIKQAQHPQYNRFGTIDLEINHPKYGWIAYTANPDDPESLGRELYDRAINGEFGRIAAYQPPSKSEQDTIEQQREEAQKKEAYINEVMPLYLEAEAGLRDPQEWKDKMAEINNNLEASK